MLSINLITANPDIRNGCPCIAGTGLRITDIAIATIFHNMLPGEIAAQYTISRAGVHAALAYYWTARPGLTQLTVFVGTRLCLSLPVGCLVRAISSLKCVTPKDMHTIGDWVKILELMHTVYTPDDMINRVEYL